MRNSNAKRRSSLRSAVFTSASRRLTIVVLALLLVAGIAAAAISQASTSNRRFGGLPDNSTKFKSGIARFFEARGYNPLGNYPDVSIPLSTNTTVTPDAVPTNTTSVNVSASTDFKGKLEGDPTTGVVRVTNAHPAGSYTVTVKGFDSAGATATKTFRLTVTTPATCNPLSFAAPRQFGSGMNIGTVGDFNGDGKQDVAGFGGANAVNVLLGAGDGTLQPALVYVVGSLPVAVAAGDFNGDGKQDLVSANLGDGSVSVLLGIGTGVFQTAINYPVFNFNVSSLVVGDFNGDGRQDLVVNNGSVLLGNGDGSFQSWFSAFSGPDGFSAPVGEFLAMGDFNADAKQDLALLGNTVTGPIFLLLGKGDGTFQWSNIYGAGSQPTSVVVGDFNGDGKQDLAAGNGQLLLGKGDGTFEPATYPNAGKFLVVGDFNGDGQQDIAGVTSRADGMLSIVLGKGDGTLMWEPNIR